MLRLLSRVTAAGVPWLVIAGLLYVGLFVKPQPVGKTVVPAAIEARDRFYGIAVVGDHAIWAVGADGKVILSNDKGMSWSVQKTPAALHLQDIAAWNDRFAVAVGNDGVVLRTEDGGQSWHQVQAPVSDVVNKLIDVKAYTDGEAWAVGAFGMIIRTQDYGRTWEQMREAEDFILNEIVRVSSGVLVAVGEFGTVLRTDDNGANWQVVDAVAEASLMSVDFRDDLNGVAVGLEGVILATGDAGLSWAAVTDSLSTPPAMTEPGTARSDSWEDMTTEHIFTVRWVEAMQRWVAAGAKGVWVTGNKELDQWESGRLAAREMAWHTALAPIDKGVIMAGRNLGIWSDRVWHVLSDR